MDKREMMAFITANPIGYMGTVEGNKPRVRAMGTARVEEDSIIYFMDYSKEVCRQLLTNPEMEVCYFADGTQLRVSGQVEEVKDKVLKQEILDDHPFFKIVVKEQDLDFIAAFRLKPVEASVMRHMERKTPIDL